jgi:hypothetical protein
MRVRTLVISLAAVVLAVPMSLVAPSAASARQEVIDPLTLNPPLTHGGPDCRWRGDLIVCKSTVAQPQPSFTIDTGLVCDGASVLQTIDYTLDLGVATYDANKDIVKLLYVDSYTGSFSNADTGASVAWTQHDRTTYDFAAPGDVSAGTFTFNGHQQVRDSSGRVILTDNGVETFDMATYTRLKSVGHHPIDDYFYGVGSADDLAPLCDALT